MRPDRTHCKPRWTSAPIAACFVGTVLLGVAVTAIAATEPSAPQLAASASTKPAPPLAARAANAPAAVKASQKPHWQDLTQAQQLSLKPLAANWGGLSAAQKRKWLAISASYPKLSPVEQATMHSRMTEWAGLSQSQRAQARLNFADTKEVANSQKAADWQAYQALSPDEKKKLGITAPSRPSGATAAAKPVQPQKLAAVPVTRPSLKQGPKMAAANHPVDPNTLLPLADPASTQKN